ncbi:hypothetical protein C3B61_17385 [Cryobacterium zongtaii]|uniref:SAM-dependent methyltransferase n=1 Tax=Cryobacterium zongtaii TaxID=1259217 RepID=A0A2S3ZAX3_9MICO|nr:hypothetical protein C3B61_17385 [Cryobacterium zongtaii]
MALQITTAYALRATEYAEQLGSMTSVHPLDLQLVTGWADRLDGPVIDAGCGPGHWTGPHGAILARVSAGADPTPRIQSQR